MSELHGQEKRVWELYGQRESVWELYGDLLYWLCLCAHTYRITQNSERSFCLKNNTPVG